MILKSKKALRWVTLFTGITTLCGVCGAGYPAHPLAWAYVHIHI